MVPSINPSSDLFLAYLQQIENRASKAQQQVTSGLRVSVASDAPDQISSIMLLRSRIASVQQTQENLATVGPSVDSAENAIQQAIQVLDTATTLATEAVTGTSDAGQRQQIVPQVQNILAQLVGLSQTVVNGRYIFSGDQDQQPLYSLNPANGNGVQQNIVPAPGRPGQIADSNGVLFSVGLTAQEIFDDGDAGDGKTYAPDNVFAAVNGLLTSLQNNDTGGIQQALDNIKAASAHLNSESSFYGAAQNRIADANTAASQTLIDLQKQLSNLQDTDMVQASLDLNSALTNEQAALASQAMVKPQSLFNYLG
jgi:flagellar hook-associated protein 3 FlgL